LKGKKIVLGLFVLVICSLVLSGCKTATEVAEEVSVGAETGEESAEMIACEEDYDCGSLSDKPIKACLGGQCVEVECRAVRDCDQMMCFEYECVPEDAVYERYQKCCYEDDPACQCEQEEYKCRTEGGATEDDKVFSVDFCAECFSQYDCGEGYRCELHHCVLK